MDSVIVVVDKLGTFNLKQNLEVAKVNAFNLKNMESNTSHYVT